MIVLLGGLACAGTITESTSDRGRIYMRTGSPFTTEYDYSLEDDPDTDVVNTDANDTEEAVSEPETYSPTYEVCESLGESAAQISPSAQQDDVIETHDEKTEKPSCETEETEEETEECNVVIECSDEDRIAAEYIAKALHGECGSGTKTAQAAVVWCVLNRVDSELPWMPDDIISVVTQEKQFAGYSDDNPVREDLLAMAMDVILRWRAEKAGETDVGRVLPKEFMYFRGDGYFNYFRNESTVTENTVFWDWSLPSPYTDEKKG